MATDLIGVPSTFKLVNRNAYFTLTSVFYRIRVFILCTPDIDRNLATIVNINKRIKNLCSAHYLNEVKSGLKQVKTNKENM